MPTSFISSMSADGPDLAVGRRAASYPLAFPFRKVAATKLDVEPLELVAGIYSC
jgi:hypothetical protein